MTSPKTRSRFTLANGVSRLAERAAHRNSASADHLPSSKRAPPKYAPLRELSVLPEGAIGWLGSGGSVTLASNMGTHASAGYTAMCQPYGVCAGLSDVCGAGEDD